jgi:cytochrome c oxidase assembly protein subunit 15
MALLALTYVQLLLGGLVAGNDAGLVHGDWPLMSGRLFPGDYAGEGVWGTVAHSRAAVQFHHRIGAYVLFAAAIAYAVLANRRASGAPVRSAAAMLAVLVTAQAALGIATLWTGVPLLLGALHQAGAVLVLTGALLVAWRASRPGAAAAPVREAFVTGWTAPPRSA